jgi:uncharacterized protein (TIGR03437 family)
LFTTLAHAQPVISGLQNNYSYLLPGTPNYAFAQGGIFVIYGSAMAPAGLLSGGFSPTLNKNLGGVSIKITVNGTTTEAIPYYVSPGQISAILPSATPVGTGTITVTYNGATSAAFPIQVVQGAFGIMTMSGNGLGQAVVMDANYNYLTPTNAAHEGQTVILWGTGQGADPNNETQIISAPQNLGSLPFQFYIGNKPAEVVYHGRSQYPGLDQIVVKIPQGVNGCYVSAYAKTGNYISNFTTIPVATGSGCGEFFATPEELVTYNSKPSVAAGWLYLGKFISNIPAITVGGTTVPASTTVTNAANAQFLRYKPFDYTNYGAISQPSYTNCVTTVFDLKTPFTAPIVQYLDPGSVTLTLPDGSVRTLVKTPNSYVLSGGGGAQPLFIPDSGGTFTFKNTGGTDVGVFSAPVTVAPAFNWTNRTAINNSVSRSQNLEITWTGGEANGYVVVTGSSSNLSNAVTSFSCTERASVGRLTVPRDVLASMLPSAQSPGAPIPTGQLIVYNYKLPVKFTAPGIDNGNISYYTGDTVLVNYQ